MTIACVVITDCDGVILWTSRLWKRVWMQATPKHVSVLNGLGYDKNASQSTLTSLGEVVRCTNTRSDGRLVSHDFVLTKLLDRYIGVSRNFAAPQPAPSVTPECIRPCVPPYAPVLPRRQVARRIPDWTEGASV